MSTFNLSWAAGDGGYSHFSLAEEVGLALKLNSKLSQAVLDSQNARLDIRTKNAKILPTLDVQMKSGSSQGSGDSDRTNSNTQVRKLSLKQPFFFSPQTNAGIEQAKAIYEFKKIGVDDKVNKVWLEVANSIMDLKYRSKVVDLKRSGLAVLNQLKDSIYRMKDSGVKRRSDVYFIESRFAMNSYGHVKAITDLKKAMLRYYSLTNHDLEVSEHYFTVPHDRIPRHAPTLQANFIENDFGLRKLNMSYLASKSVLKESRYKFAPSVYLGADVTRSITKANGALSLITDTTNANVVFDYNIYNGGMDRVSFQKAQNNLAKVEIAIDDGKRQASINAETLLANYKLKEDEINALKESLKIQNHAWDDYLELFGVGSESIANVLGLQQDLLKSQMDLYKAQYDYDKLGVELLSKIYLLSDVFGDDLYG